MAIDACGFSREETRKAFMLKWGDVFGFDCHDFEPEREGIEPSEILYFTVVMSFSPSLKAL